MRIAGVVVLEKLHYNRTVPSPLSRVHVLARLPNSAKARPATLFRNHHSTPHPDTLFHASLSCLLQLPLMVLENGGR